MAAQALQVRRRHRRPGSQAEPAGDEAGPRPAGHRGVDQDRRAVRRHPGPEPHLQPESGTVMARYVVTARVVVEARDEDEALDVGFNRVTRRDSPYGPDYAYAAPVHEDGCGAIHDRHTPCALGIEGELGIEQ